MKTFGRVGALVLVCLGASAQTTLPEIAQVRDPYQRNIATIRQTRDQRVAAITTAYTASLTRLAAQTSTVAADSTAVNAERERVEAKRPPTEQERKEMPRALAELRMRFENDVARSNAPFLQQEQQMTRQYVAALDTLQRRLAAQNQIAKAAAVRDERQTAAATLPNDLSEQVGQNRGAETTIGRETAKAAGALDGPLAEKIKAAAVAKNYTRSENSGQEGETKGWADVPEEGGLLVGFEFFEVGKESWIRSLRPYFLTPKGIVAGTDRGKMEKVTNKVLARPGYAVAGVLTTGGKRGIQVVFMKIDPATGRLSTDSTSTYKSTWFGDKGREKPKQIGGDGRFVIGVYGKTGANCDDLGMVLMN